LNSPRIYTLKNPEARGEEKMLKILLNKESFITIMLTAIIIVLALFGTQWQIGKAEIIPTIPIIYSYAPQEICVNTGDTLVTVNGDDFIDTTYTWILWLDAFNVYSYIVPETVNQYGTQLIFTVESAKLTQAYEAKFWIENHPPGSLEKVGPFSIDVIGCEFIYLPLIAK
jgi:hypothetical protein